MFTNRSDTDGSTFHLVLLRVEENSRSDVVVTFELLHGFESDQKHSRIVKLLDGVHLVLLHHYLLLTIHLQHRNKQRGKKTATKTLINH